MDEEEGSAERFERERIGRQFNELIHENRGKPAPRMGSGIGGCLLIVFVVGMLFQVFTHFMEWSAPFWNWLAKVTGHA